MCGIISVISGNGPIAERLLIAMRDSMIHRGPDAEGLWIEGSVGFGQRRLSILDLHAHSDQPFVSEDGRFVLNYNGELYNYIELREELVGLGRGFRTESDTEVLLQALIHWGIDALPRFNGMFAFTLWDCEEKTLLVARDRFGEKPLFYYTSSAYGFAAGSEMKSMLTDERVPDDIDQDVMLAYQNGVYYEDGEDTFFKHIKRLPPAHFALVNKDGVIQSIKRYWTPDYNDINTSISRAEAVEQFGALLKDSVAKRLRADVPVGSSLSGGMDSSAIVGYIAALRRENPNAATQNVFSARFDQDATISEGPFIDQVVEFNNVIPFSVTPQPDRLVEELVKLHWHQEEPFLSASIYLQWCVSRLAQESDTTVLLDGQGADELLGGYQFYYKNYQLDLMDEGKYLKLIKDTYLFSSRLQYAARGYENADRRFNVKVAFSMPELFVQLGHRHSPYSGGYSVGVPEIQRGNRFRRQIAEALQFNTLPQLLRYADRSSMAFSREARLPFLDHKLVDFVISLPDDLLIHDGWQKYPLRKSSGQVVPKEVVWRADKVGYAAPLDIWIRNELKDWARDRLFNGPASQLEGFDRDAMQKLWNIHQADKANHSWAFWRWISLSEWLDMHANSGLRKVA